MMRRLVVGACALALLAGAGVAAAAWEATPSPRLLPGRAVAVSPLLARAVVATEDERFYRHHGIDLVGLLRAIPYDVVHASFAQGASTITEQVAKLLYLHGNDHRPWRKLEDMALAVKLENRYSKAQILDAYLERAPFGGAKGGVAAASRRYFGVGPARLTLAQASLLAGLPQAPSVYDPLRHPAAARARQATVLRSLVRIGDLTAARAASVLARPLRLRGGTVLAPVRGVELAPGPTFAWGALAAGGMLALAGAFLLALRRFPRANRILLSRGIVLACALLILLGTAVALRSFRTA